MKLLGLVSNMLKIFHHGSSRSEMRIDGDELVGSPAIQTSHGEKASGDMLPSGNLT